MQQSYHARMQLTAIWIVRIALVLMWLALFIGGPLFLTAYVLSVVGLVLLVV